MIVLPEVQSDSKTILVYTKPLPTLFVLLRMKELYDSLDNVIMLYYPFVEMLQYYLGHTKPKVSFLEETAEIYQSFNAMCEDLGVTNKIEFKDLDEVTFSNGDNLILDHHRLDPYIDTINLGLEKNLDISDVTSIVAPRNKNAKAFMSFAEDITKNFITNNDKVFNPVENITRDEMLDMFNENEIDIMRKYSEFEMSTP